MRLSILFTTLILLFSTVSPVHAFDIRDSFYNPDVYNNTDGGVAGPNTLANIYNPIINMIFIIGGLMVLFGFIYGGFIIVSNSGNAQKVSQGQSVLTNTLMGLFLLFAVYWIVQLVEMVTGLNLLNPIL